MCVRKALDGAHDAITKSNLELGSYAKELTATKEVMDQQQDELKENKSEIKKLVDYDQMTGFMNAHKFVHTVYKRMEIWKQLYIVYITITNIDNVSNSLDFGIYDSLLHRISVRINDALDQSIYDLGIIKGDNIVLLTSINQRDLSNDLDKILAIFDSPFYSDYYSFRLFAKIGVACYPHDDHTAEALIKKASIAAVSLLDEQQSQYTYFSKLMQQKIFEEQKLFAEIDLAIKEHQFVMYYQPKFANDGKTLMGYESLIRWQMPDGRLRSPSEFIDIAEKTGQIVFIGQQVIDMVCSDIKNYQLDKKHIHVSLNLSSQHLENEETIDYLKRTVNKYDIRNSALEIEITETSLVDNFESARALLKRLRHDGFTIALDDFGTGYSSLSYIRNLPINKIKIDRMFISQMPNVKYMKVLKAIMNLSKDLYYRVTVEGIETKEQWEMLKPFEPNELQGFYFSKPLPIEEAVKFLK